MDAGFVLLGIVILLPDPLAGRVHEVRSALGDPVPMPTHITLVPPTPVDPSRLTAVAAHLGAVAADEEPFEVRLQGTASFRPVTDVTYLRVVEGGDACDRLQRRTRSGPLSSVELRYPYHPHVTVAHDVPPAALDRAERELAGVDEAFTVDRFVLFTGEPEDALAPEREFVLSGRRRLSPVGRSNGSAAGGSTPAFPRSR